MQAVVTGGAGFLGSHLCSRLLDDGNEVVCIDNFLTSTPANVEHLIGREGFVLVRYNATDYLHVAGEVSAIFHFASPASPRDYLELPIQTLKVGALGAHKALGLAKAKGARFVLASTSEVYGDPQVHPQAEDYWGHVNPVGPRGVYDEGKRFAEALTMAYHRTHDIDTKIVRIFNSILADQAIVAIHDGQLHVEPVDEYAMRVELASTEQPEVLVPAFDPVSLKMELKPASALIEHVSNTDAYELQLRYGRSVKVTGDHSVFVRGQDERPVAKPVRELSVGDHVAIPSRLPVVERDRSRIDIARELMQVIEDPDELWDWAICSPEVPQIIERWREKVHLILERSGRYRETKNLRNTLTCTTNRWRKTSVLPLAVLQQLGLEVPNDAQFGPYRGRSRWIRNEVEITPDLLWTLGLYLAEGAEEGRRGVYFISMCSDMEYLDRAQRVLEAHFDVHVGRTTPSESHGPSLYAHSKALHSTFVRLLSLRERRFPRWVMQLPLHRLKHFLEGFRCGDGTHSGVMLGQRLCFETTSQALAHDLNLVLLRFGIVASLGHYETTFKQKYGDRRFPFYRLTVSALDDFDILNWDRGVRQTLNARRSGDLVWSMVKSIERCAPTEYVYDFSVPGSENFVAGTGVACHNTFGPRMRAHDGRAVPEFITAALQGRPLVVHGDGSQTRSLCFVDDLIEGIVRLAASDHIGPMNIGNPGELSMLELAKLVVEIAESDSSIDFGPRPVDDPNVRKPDISLAKRVLGWEPEVPLAEGLARTIEWFRAREEA